MRVALVPVFLLGQLLERVFRRRRGQGPFQRIRVFVPLVRACLFPTTQQGVEHDAEEQQERGERDERTNPRNEVPLSKRFRVVDIAYTEYGKLLGSSFISDLTKYIDEMDK